MAGLSCRHKKERLRKKNQAAAQKYQEDLIARSRLRFSNVPMVLQVLQELQDQNWSAIYTREGCEIRKDRIITPVRSYLYIQYGLQNPDNQELLELATYISSVCPLECRLATISHFRGGMSPSYSGHVSSDGSVSLVRDSWGDSVLDGYRVLKKEVPQPQPQGRAWYPPGLLGFSFCFFRNHK